MGSKESENPRLELIILLWQGMTYLLFFYVIIGTSEVQLSVKTM